MDRSVGAHRPNPSCAVIFAVLISIVAGCSGDTPSVKQTSQGKRIPVDNSAGESRVEEMLQRARDALLKSPNDPAVLTDAARATAASGDLREAAGLLAEAARAAGFRPASRVELGMRAFLEVGELYPAIELLSHAVTADPSSHKLRRLLFGLLGEAGRTDQMQEHFEAIIRNRKFDVSILLALTETSERLFPDSTIENLVERNPDDHRLRLGLAQSLRDERNFIEAEAVLRQIIHHHPDFSPAHAMLGRMPGVQQAPSETFAAWLSGAWPVCREQADFWIAMGDRYSQTEESTAALACYLEASRLGPNMAVPWTQISVSLRQMNEGSEREHPGLGEDVVASIAFACDRRAKLLFDLRFHLQRFGGSDERSQRAASDIARVLDEMGRRWEAEAWSAIAMTLPEDLDPHLGELRESIIGRLKRNQEWSLLPDLTALDAYTRRSDTDIPLPGIASTGPQRRMVGAIELRLDDETRSRGLVVSSRKYPDIQSSLIHTLGTGGGTLDIDLDGWSDLIIRNGGEVRDDISSNTLLRNIDGGFQDISTQSRCGNTRFGQAATIGDYNEDGFPDVFLANVGGNHLLRNNGDGTFSDDTEALGPLLNQWTTAGAFVDLDGDGITDLVVVNYCDLNSGVDKPCQTQRGPAPCHPAKFPADHNQLLMATGRGRFSESLADDIRKISPGRGLGILAGSLAGGAPSALVANDMSANHLLRVTDQGLADLAVPFGVAVDGRSLAQASMGIAYGDFDGDLDLDLYVTGFAREYNIYYEQRSAGVWVDSTGREGLIAPTVMAVGFGTQAIDIDGDGIDELAISNGHIGDFGPNQPSLAQAFQLMRRSEDGTFEQVETTPRSPYLESNHVGRALWKIDVDRDLADDLVVTHQNKPPVLLSNRTESDNNRVGVRCIGTKSSRDAIGATVEFDVSGHRRALWLLSGDGYMGSNERTLKAGLGSADRAEEVTVTWPSGSVEGFGRLRAGRTYLLVEGSGDAFTSH